MECRGLAARGTAAIGQVWRGQARSGSLGMAVRRWARHGQVKSGKAVEACYGGERWPLDVAWIGRRGVDGRGNTRSGMAVMARFGVFWTDGRGLVTQSRCGQSW